MSRLSSLAAVVLLGIGTLAIWMAVVQPALDWRAAILLRTDAARTEHARLLSATARLNAEEAAFEPGGLDGLYWTGGQTGEVYARIQSRLSQSAAKNGIAFRAITPLPTNREGDLETAVVRIEFEADLGQMTEFLRDIEYASPALPIKRANLRRLVKPNDTSVQPVLFTQIDIAAPILLGSGTR